MTSCHGPEDHCITCADEGVPMLVVTADAGADLAQCSAPDGALRTVDTGIVGAVAEGDELLVHAGTALTRLGGRS